MSEPRERLLEKASEIFYADGIHAVGVDRIVGEAHVTRATFYRHFPSKGNLVRAYIEREDAAVREALAAAQASGAEPIALLGMLVEHLCGVITAERFRGCPFINAAAEYPDPADPVREAISEHRRWFSETIEALFATAGHPDPEEAARTLFMVRDGAMVAAYLGTPDHAVADLRRTVTALFEEHRTRRTGPRSRRPPSGRRD
jgi:AcrR family transcriptional regulator